MFCNNLYFISKVGIAMQKITTRVVDIFVPLTYSMEDPKDLSIHMDNGRYALLWNRNIYIFSTFLCSEVLVDIKCCCFIDRSLLISQMISTLGVTEKDMKSTLKLNALNNACK